MKCSAKQEKKEYFCRRKRSFVTLGRYLSFDELEGEMLEWLKRHAWKACKRQKRFGGSNPPLSAEKD